MAEWNKQSSSTMKGFFDICESGRLAEVSESAPKNRFRWVTSWPIDQEYSTDELRSDDEYRDNIHDKSDEEATQKKKLFRKLFPKTLTL